MVAAVLYGAFSLLFSSSPKETRKRNATAQIPVSDFVTDLIMRMKKADATIRDSRIINKALAAWKNDPFLVMQEIKVEDEEIQKEAEIISSDQLTGAFNYSGYMQMGLNQLAIINGMEYQKGDRLEIQGAVLQKISPKEIHIMLEEENVIVVVPIEETGG